MRIIGLEEMLDMGESLGNEAEFVSWTRGAKVRSQSCIALLPWTVSILAIGFSVASVGQLGHDIHRSAALAHQQALGDLSEATLEAAWQSAAQRLNEKGHDVGAMLKKASSRADAWRSAPVVGDDESDDADEA
ncbi:MAG: hypothetical protein ACRELY_26615 [Polyangiaceae bacterium]